MIVSVSRRCDIPRFQFKWFMERLKVGFVDAVNPFNARQIKRIPLVPMKEGLDSAEGVDAFVFWTRDPRKILANADELTERGFPFYVMVTLTAYPSALEPSMISASKVLAGMKALALKIGPEKLIWRYDPVILSNLTNEDFHRANFNELALNLAGSVRRVIVSLYNEYPKTKTRFDGLQRAGVLQLLDAASLPQLLAGFAKSAEAAGLEIQSCAEKENYTSLGIKPGACIDAAIMQKLFGLEFAGKDKNQRPHCLCCKSVDIGAYGLCAAHCVYCYAW